MTCPTTGVLRIFPITLAQARQFVADHHRHSDPPQGGNWAICLMRDGDLVGVGIAGRPVSKVMQRRGYLEITRICVMPDVRNGCSMLYGRIRRIGQLMGYQRFLSYTLASEPGDSLRAAGFEAVAKVRGQQADRPSRRRALRATTPDRIRWESRV
jgi:hypothetical protein